LISIDERLAKTSLPLFGSILINVVQNEQFSCSIVIDRRAGLRSLQFVKFQ